jgi:N6-L-threonylcarbamoyladenine synthase
LKTAVRQHLPKVTTDRDRADLASSFQAAVVDVLKDRVANAMKQFRTLYGNRRVKFVAAGGVAANKAIRQALEAASGGGDFDLVLPPAELCTDNAAMVAWAGLERLALGLVDPLDAAPLARWPLESLGKPRSSRPEEVPAG